MTGINNSLSIVSQLLSGRLFQSKMKSLIYDAIVRMLKQKKLDEGVLKKREGPTGKKVDIFQYSRRWVAALEKFQGAHHGAKEASVTATSFSWRKAHEGPKNIKQSSM